MAVKVLYIDGSPRERELFRYLVQGYSFEEASKAMGIKICTVQLYGTNLLKKNRRKSMHKLICDYYLSRLEHMKQKITNIKERYKYVNKRRQGTVYNENDDFGSDVSRDE